MVPAYASAAIATRTSARLTAPTQRGLSFTGCAPLRR